MFSVLYLTYCLGKGKKQHNKYLKKLLLLLVNGNPRMHLFLMIGSTVHSEQYSPIIMLLPLLPGTPTHVNILHALHNVSGNLRWFALFVLDPPLLPELAVSHPGVDGLLLLPELSPGVQVLNASQN